MKMTDNEGCSKQYKRSCVSQTSKRSKLTLSLKTDSVIRNPDNFRTGQVCSKTLQDELLQLSTGSTYECSTQNKSSDTITFDNRTDKLCGPDINYDVISIKSDSEKLEENTAHATCSKSESVDSQVNNVKVTKRKASSDEVRECCEDEYIDKLSSSGNLPSEDLPDINCSFLATCRTVVNIPTDGISRSEGNNGSSDRVGHGEMLLNLETKESDSACRVEAWLCNQDIGKDSGRVDAKGAAEDAELEVKGEPSVGKTERRVTSEFFSESEGQQEPIDEVGQCPLCWKKLDKKVTSHLKLCATRNNVTTQQLLEALELQRRQTEERRALGLPVVRAAAASKKSSAPRKDLPRGDTNLQLALALSASLQEVEEREQDALLESGVVEPMNLSPTVVQKQLSLLEKFGFTSSRPAVLCSRQKTSLSKARLKSYPLLNRTKEERERLITEKVAIVLMGEEDVVQAPPGSQVKWQDNTAISSDLLLSFQDKENQLWEMARDVSADVNTEHYYVQSLAGHISPCKVEPGAKLKHLSQIHGRVNTPKTSSRSEESKRNGSPCVSSEVKSLKPHSQQIKEKFKNVKKLLNFSPVMQNSPCAVKSSVKKQQHALHATSLGEDWASVMNKQAMSDITIHVSGGREIPAHKLVFYVRCPALLYDLIKEESNGKVRELLMWVDVSYEAALAFLEFLYCGTMNRILHLGDDVSYLKTLARQYQVVEIVQHLEVMHKVRARVSQDGGYISNASMISTVTKEDLIVTGRSLEKTNTLAANSPDVNCLPNKIVPGSPSPYCEMENICTTTIGQRNTPSCEVKHVSHCSSPDMFDDECTTEENASQGSRASVDCLLSLMNKGSAANSNKFDETDVIYCDSLSSGESVLKEHKSHANMLGGFCKNISPGKTLFEEEQKYTDVDEGLPKEIVSEKLENSCTQTKKKSLTPDTQKNNSDSSRFSELNVARLPTLDLTQDSSDEELMTQHNTPPNKVCDGNNTCFDSTSVSREHVNTRCEESCGSRILGKLSQSKRADKSVDGIEQETVQNTDHGANSEPDVTFVDNVWDDFDDLGVVPNLSFYSSPSRNHEMVSTTRSAGWKSLSPNTRSSPVSSSPQGSPGKQYRNKTKTPSTGRSVVAEEVSRMLNRGEVSPCRDTSPSAVCRTPEKVESNYKGLLEDSLVDNWNNSALWRGECEEPLGVDQGSGVGTPEEPSKVVTNKATPLPDYSAMKTPLLKEELFRYGVKPLKRKHAKQILRHIYNELHPFADKEVPGGECSIPAHPAGSQSSKSLFKEPGPGTVVPRSPRKRLSASPSPKKSECAGAATSRTSGSDCEDLSQGSSCSSVSSDNSTTDEMILEMESLDQADHSSSEKESVDFRKAVYQYIRSTPELFEKILLYEPIWLEELQAKLKTQNLKFSKAQLMDYLDEQCITFRTAQGQRNRARKKERKRKSSGSVSQKSRGRPKKKACTQPS